MADTYFLNGCSTDIGIVVNGGDEYSLRAFTLDGNPNQTAKLGLSVSRARNQIGLGMNEILIKIGGAATLYRVELTDKVIISLDVQFLVLATALHAKNTISTDGFKITIAPDKVRREVHDMAFAETPGQAQRGPPAISAAAETIAFTRMGGDAKGTIYTASNNGPGGNGVALTFYYLFASASEPLGSLTLQESFANEGAYVFTDEALTAPVLLVELGAALSIDGTVFSRLAWRRAAGRYDLIKASTASAVATDVTLPIGSWQLFLRQNTVLSLDDSEPAIRLTGAAQEDSIQVQIVVGGLPKVQGTRPDVVLLPLVGDHRGALTFAWDWSHFSLESRFGGNLRVFFGADSKSARMAQYPLFTPAPEPGRFDPNNLFFNTYFQPMAPLDGKRTRLALDLSQPSALTSTYVSSATNAAVRLVPAAKPLRESLTAGFGFAKNADNQFSTRYLCPVGEYEVAGLVKTPSTSASLAVDDRIQIRGGLAATEYVLVKPGDHLCFENDRPAFAGNYKPAKGVPADLTDALTTAWILAVRQTAADAAPAKELVNTSYCAQSAASTYFGHDIASAARYAFPIAVGASLVQFDRKGPQSAPLDEDEAFPLMPYGGVYFSDPDKGIPSPNPDLSSQELAALERQVIARGRRTQLAPHFDKIYGPIFFDTSTNAAFDGGYARTPLGLLAELNKAGAGAPPAGSVKSIILARSPQNADQFAALIADKNGVVNPVFSNAVLNENLFLVATNAAALEPFAKEIQLGDFTFQLNLGNADNQAIAIFKFVPNVPLSALIADTLTWTPLIEGVSEASVQARLNGYVAAAKAGGSLFDSFLALLDDPNWTGLLFINSPLNYQALPLDIQILLGGINGQLRAHHFGVTISRVETISVTSRIQRSSLFAVIHYQQDFVGPDKNPRFAWPNFQVLLLNVRYANSKLVVFDSKIAFSIDTLFGSKVKLAVAPPDDRKESGTIEIDGVYTLYEDGTGSLVFSTRDPRSYVFDKADARTVLTAQSVGDAKLAPVSRKPGTGECAILATSAFRLDGLTAFRDGVGGDIFSYGEMNGDMPTKGLAITGYSFAMTTCIRADNTAKLQGGIPADLSGLKVDQVRSVARAKSLKSTLPSSIQALDYTASGLKPTADGEWQVRIDGKAFVGAPVYSLRFDIPLGSFGALAVQNSGLTATLFVGWNPAEVNPDKNVGVLLRLPPQIAGPKGFNFEGILSSSFEYVQIDRLELTGAEIISILRFVHYQGQLLGLLFTYDTGPKDLGIFGSPGDPGGTNSMFFIGKSADSKWKGPVVSFALDGVPIVYLLRAYEVKTDPTNPNVISDVFDALNPFNGKTVAEFVSLINANRSLYNSDAGFAFGIQFEYKSLNLTAVLHDNTFYGAQIKLTPQKKEKKKNGGGGKGDDGRERAVQLVTATASIRDILSTTVVLTANGDEPKDGDGKDDNGFLSKIKNFTFTIIYRKVSDEVGVFSADIYLNLGQINLGAFQLSLPNFSISIWTNGDWRFAIGWPFMGSSAHPLTLQFQAGPVPVIAKAGFYLAKLSSAAAPDQFGKDFGLIWSFGVGLAAGVGKEFKQGPLKAGASLILGLTVEGFLASFDGTFTSNGVDYYWWGISISLTGNVFGEVDFVVISVDVSLTVTITVAFAIETKHKTPLTLTASVKVKASIKILFIKISFSFSATLDILSTEFGSGNATAKLSGPTPNKVSLHALERSARMTRMAMMRRGAPAARLRTPMTHVRTAAAAPARLPIVFVLQPTSVSTDGAAWAPQGVATLLIETGDLESAFGSLATGLARWLLANFGSGATFHDQLLATAAALDSGAFQSRVAEALSATFIFEIDGGKPAADKTFVSFPMPDSLSLVYGGAAARARFGDQRLPGDYKDQITRYFGGEASAGAGADVSIAAMLFDEFFVMLGQQLVQLMIETGAPDVNAALRELNVGDLGGFVSRFLMGGLRLPDPSDPGSLRALYVLTGQQFPLRQEEGDWVLTAELQATDSTPAWIEVAPGAGSALEPGMVHTTGPSSVPWRATQMPPLTIGPRIFAMNNIVNWVDGKGVTNIINSLPEAVRQVVRGASQGSLYLSQRLAGGESDADQEVDLGVPGIPWISTAVLALPVRLAAIPDPSGDPGAILPDVFSLLGTDEASRALLQALLDDSGAALTAVDLLLSPDRGNWVSTAVPAVLVRADLSTTSAPASAVSAAVGGTGPNYAKLAEGGDQLRAFLRLLWEVSVVHTTGFYLQVDGLKAEMFAQGPADMMVLVRFGASGAILAAKPYQNALVGAPPEAGKAIFSTLAIDPSGTPAPAYSATYPGGSVGWSILWEDAPAEADASGETFLRDLYQLISYRVTAIDGKPIQQNWSRPVTATDSSAKDDKHATWTYQLAFATAPLVGSENRYGAVGDRLTVKLSVEDVFGNTLPDKLSPSIDLEVVFNDELLGLGNWTGSQASYLVDNVGGLNLRLDFTFDPAIVLDPEGGKDPDLLRSVTALYAQAADQLGDTNASGRRVTAGIDTHGILAPDVLRVVTSGVTLTEALAAYVTTVLAWLRAGATGTPPAGATIRLRLTQSQPANWPGDLQELQVDLTLDRSDVPDAIAALSPQVRRSVSPIQPVEEKADPKGDPSGLTTFALAFETAYYPFDGKTGTVKVATGANSDMSSVRFGQRSIWLQRWGAGAGTEVEILNDAANPPVFYAPPPLSTQLITREVKGLRQYARPGQFDTVNMVFSSVDLDLWARQFLSAVETIFAPAMAPNVADNSSARVEVYDPFVTNKESLAGTLSQKIEYVYVEPDGTGDPVSARETWRQALLRSLENDYGFSTLTQLKAIVRLKGPIEPLGDARFPPQLYGSVQTPGTADNTKLPYALSPAALPLKPGQNWLNFLTAAQDPEAQRAFSLNLNYEVNQLEHQRDGNASDRGYVPSNWLTFILQQNPATLPQGQRNTLTQPIGNTRIPVPLRTYPPLPKLQVAKAVQPTGIGSIDQALTWTAAVNVERSGANQDTLNLSLTFNEPLTVSEPASAMRAEREGREPPTDLFAGLARFVTEYPQLRPFIEALERQGPPASVEAVQAFSQIIGDVALVWPAWKPPQSENGNIEGIRRLMAEAGAPPIEPEAWNFAIQNAENPATNLEVTASWSRGDAAPPWPMIAGYTKIGESGNTATYQPGDDGARDLLELTWSGLFVLDYQSMRPSAYTLRNQNLAPKGEQTNPNFVYRTETIKWPTPVVPLITVANLIVLAPPATPDSSLEAAVQSMLTQLMTAPEHSITNGSNQSLEFESPIDYRYRVIANPDSDAFTSLPVFLVGGTVQPGGERAEAEKISQNLKKWRDTTGAASDSSSLRFLLTIFANTIAAQEDRLPLVQFQQLVIPAKNDDAWW
jgi:hypothetical protein